MNAPPRIPPLSPTPPLSRSLGAGRGAARPPAAAQVFGLSDAAGDSRRQIWRFGDGSDTLDYVVAEGAGRVLQAEWREGGQAPAPRTPPPGGRGPPAGGPPPLSRGAGPVLGPAGGGGAP